MNERNESDTRMARRAFLASGGVAALMSGGCSMLPPGENVTHLVVHKSQRRLLAYYGHAIVADYPISLGFAPRGHKREEGDGKTPVGNYIIDRRNGRSKFHLSLGISYPNEEDRKSAATRGVRPGGHIYIHGQPNDSPIIRRGDWTAGCIAVNNWQMTQLYETVAIGTPIEILP